MANESDFSSRWMERSRTLPRHGAQRLRPIQHRGRNGLPHFKKRNRPAASQRRFASAHFRRLFGRNPSAHKISLARAIVRKVFQPRASYALRPARCRRYAER